jgi:hypothetical protein
MICSVEKQVTQVGSRFIATIKYDNIVCQNPSDSLFRCPYQALFELTDGLIEYLDTKDDCFGFDEQ